MATAYTEFNCLGTDLLTTLRTAILASSDWARPNAAGKPDLYKATTTRGAQMAVDLNAVALTTQAATLDVFHSHDGTTGVSAARRYLRMKENAVGTLAANTYHGVVSAGKEHLFLSIEGPRASEANTDSTIYGSPRNYLAISDLVPYFAGDVIPAVIHTANIVNGVSSSVNNSHLAFASRDGLDSQYHSAGHLYTLDFPAGNAGDHYNNQMLASLDSNNLYLAPYVFFDSNQGIRGRLSSLFYAGYNFANIYDAPVPPVGQVVTYGGKQYKLLAVCKGASSSATTSYAGLGAVANNSSLSHYSPVVAVPYA